MSQFFRNKVDSRALPNAVRVKWNDVLLDEGFVPMPKRLLRCASKVLKNFGMHHLQVVMAIADFRRPDIQTNPSLDYIAHLAGLDVDKCEQALKELREFKLAKITGTRGDLEIDLGPLFKRIEELTELDDRRSPEEEIPF